MIGPTFSGRIALIIMICQPALAIADQIRLAVGVRVALGHFLDKAGLACGI
jgi:hypothetical protein